MKWVKHYENASSNRILDSLLTHKRGHEFYGMYWLLINGLTKEFKKDTTVFEFTEDRLCSILRVKYFKKVETFLQVLVEIAERLERDFINISEISTTTQRKIIKIETPIILELIGKEFKRTRQCRGQDAAKNKKKNKEKEIYITPVKKPEKLKFDFEKLYAKYPRKMGKTNGIKKCKRLIKTQTDFELLEKAIDNYNREIVCAQTETRFIKHFSTFLSSWKDYLEVDIGSIQKINSKAIYEAVASGARKLELVPDNLGLTEHDKDWIRNNGGLMTLGRKNEFEFNKLLKSKSS